MVVVFILHNMVDCLRNPAVGGLVVEEQQEKLRRFVDEWRGEVSETLETVADNGLTGVASRDTGAINQDPIHIRTQFLDDASILDLVTTENVGLNKVVTVLAFDCLEIHRLRKLVSGYTFHESCL